MDHTRDQPAMYQLRLEFRIEDGPPIRAERLTPADFARAVQAAYFDALRRGKLDEYDPAATAAIIEPRFVRNSGAPLTTGFRVLIPTPHGARHELDFGLSFFHNRASRVRAELTRDQQAASEVSVYYHLAAYLDGDDVKPAGNCRLSIEPERTTIPIHAGPAIDARTTTAWDDPQPDDLPVFIARSVLDDALAQARRCPEREVGGVLLGKLRRDPAGRLYLDVTCQVPAEGAEATSTSVTFTPAVWERARQIAGLRCQGEIFVGWVHSHPFRLCAECPLPTPPECLAKVLFFSADDEFLMELSFAQPFMVGLLTAVEPRLETALGHLPVRLYGWRKGEIQARGFYVVDE
jgi:proteasome lid subunit RPN8/RPN11